jgi:hypothetical protein
VGDDIFVALDRTKLLLGKITGGSFSTSRGMFHGLGFIGAGRLLSALYSTSRPSFIMDKENRRAGVKVAVRGVSGDPVRSVFLFLAIDEVIL